MNWNRLRTVELGLAVAVLFVVATLSSIVPVEYPSWPTLGGVPVDPELVVPGALGAVVLANATRDVVGRLSDGIASAIRSERTLWSIGIGLLAAATLYLAIVSLYTLYAGTGGCVFFGGFLTLAAGIPLAGLVLGKRVAGSAYGWYRRRTAGRG